MIRFKLRTLLIVTALIAVFIGLQMHVQMKAKRFIEATNEDGPNDFQLRFLRDAGIESDDIMFLTFEDGRYSIWGQLEPMTFADFVMFRRRCFVEFLSHSRNDRTILTDHLHRYWLHAFGERCEREGRPKLLFDGSNVTPIL